MYSFLSCVNYKFCILAVERTTDSKTHNQREKKDLK